MVEDLAVENCSDNIFAVGRIELRGLRLENGRNTGVFAVAVPGMLVSDCLFINCAPGIFTGTDTQNVLVERCDFLDNYVGASFNRSRGIVVLDSEFDGGRVGLNFAEDTTATVMRCAFGAEIEVSGVAIVNHSDVELRSCRFAAASQNFMVTVASILRGRDNLLNGGSWATIEFATNSTADFHGNHILKGDGYSIRTTDYKTDPVDIDLTGNYWGTTEADAISAWILDGNDEHPVWLPNYSNVLFEPFSTTPLPTERRSMGSFKALFGGE